MLNSLQVNLIVGLVGRFKLARLNVLSASSR